MDYFVSLEDTAYCLWQSELLIQSFKMLGLQDRLVLAVAGSSQPKLVNFTRNLAAHKRRFLHDNIGRKRGVVALNRPFAAYTALKNGTLTQPFTLLSPDMVLAKEVKRGEANVAFQINPGFTREACEAQGVPVGQAVTDLLSGVERADKNCWVPLGSVMTFDGVPEEFFQSVVNWTETLEFGRQTAAVAGGAKPAPSNASEKAAWVMALIEYWGKLSVQGKADLEMNLLDHQRENHFVHYKHGLPPHFSKGMFRYEPPAALALGDLFHTLLSHNPTTSTNVLQQVVRAYVEEHGIDVAQPQPEEIVLGIAGNSGAEENT